MLFKLSAALSYSSLAHIPGYGPLLTFPLTEGGLVVHVWLNSGQRGGEVSLLGNSQTPLDGGGREGGREREREPSWLCGAVLGT